MKGRWGGREREKRSEQVRERKGGRKWVRGWAQWTDSFARLLLSFPLYVSTSVALHRTTRPLLHSVIYSQYGADTRRWQLLYHTATLTHNHYWPICDCSLWIALFIIYQSWFKEKSISCESVPMSVWSVRCVVFQYDTVNKQEKALYPPPASLVPRHLCQSHFGLLMRHRPSAPPPHLRLQLFLLTGKSVTKV